MSLYYVQANSLSVSDAGDFLQLRNPGGVICLVKEIRVWQTSDTALAMNAVRFNRGAGGAAGASAPPTAREMDIAGASAVATAHSLPTTDVSSLDLDVHVGWNILQEMVWLATPELEIHLAASDHLGISLLTADTLTIGASIFWQEIGV